MGMHDEYVQKIQDQAKRLKENSIDFNDKATCEREKVLLCGALIKCADISNCVSVLHQHYSYIRI
jgi:nitrogenase molybdenum-iron protein alpha/beta subunit